jgi:hypothetical protein
MDHAERMKVEIRRDEIAHADKPDGRERPVFRPGSPVLTIVEPTDGPEAAERSLSAALLVSRKGCDRGTSGREKVLCQHRLAAENLAKIVKSC